MRILLSGIIALSLFLVGCNESKKSRGSANARGVRSQNPPGAGGTSGGTGGGTAATLQALNCQGDAWGLIYDDGTVQNQVVGGQRLNWQQAVQIFAAGSVNYEDVGEVSGLKSSTTTGISFCGRICQNPQSPQNEVYIGIWDSKFLNNEFDSEISVNIKHNGAYNGRLTSSNPATFRDDFGTIEFVGSTGMSGIASGQFCFTNNVLLGNAPQSVKGQRICLGRWEIRVDRFWRTTEC